MRKMFDIIEMVTWIVLFMVVSILFTYIQAEKIFLEKDRASTELCQQAIDGYDKTTWLHGFHSTEHYYCVSTDEAWFNVNKARLHEECHEMVIEDPEHFYC